MIVLSYLGRKTLVKFKAWHSTQKFLRVCFLFWGCSGLVGFLFVHSGVLFGWFWFMCVWFFPISFSDFWFHTCFQLWSPLSLQNNAQSGDETQMLYNTVETCTCWRGNLTRMRMRRQLQPQLWGANLLCKFCYSLLGLWFFNLSSSYIQESDNCQNTEITQCRRYVEKYYESFVTHALDRFEEDYINFLTLAATTIIKKVTPRRKIGVTSLH